ncbi:MAG: CinA family protein [Aquabacterium sp.]
MPGPLDLQALFDLGCAVGDRLAARGETIAVSESSAGGLLSAALLARAGASAYYLGGAVLYTRRAGRLLTTLTAEDMAGLRSSSPPYAQLLARHQRQRFKASWGLAETGAAGPSGNTYGDPAGHSCLAVDGPVAMQRLLRTDSDHRADNMLRFAMAALQLLAEALDAAGPPVITPATGAAPETPR